MVNYINKYYKTLSKREVEEFLWCTVKCDLTNMNLNIYQSNLIFLNQGFNDDVKTLMKFNNPATPHKGNYLKWEMGTKNPKQGT